VVLNRTGSRIGGLDPESVAAGVEEEFHTVDLATRRLTGRAARLVEQLPADRFSSEL
jgi:glutamate---cysteine ligase / carboxylate-amine ligase